MKRIAFIICWLIASTGAYAQQDIYDRYASHEGLFVAYAQGYQLDSNNRIDIIYIQAEDSAAWEWMRAEFNVPEANKRAWASGSECVFSHLSPISNPQKVAQFDDNAPLHCMVLGSHNQRALCLAFITRREQIKLLLHNFYFNRKAQNQ